MEKNVLIRTRFDILENMLSFSKKKRSKTSIMQNASLNYSHLVQYLDFLLENNLLSLENCKNLAYYKTTPKGLNFLNMINELRNIINPEVDAVRNKLIQLAEFSNC